MVDHETVEGKTEASERPLFSQRWSVLTSQFQKFIIYSQNSHTHHQLPLAPTASPRQLPTVLEIFHVYCVSMILRYGM